LAVVSVISLPDVVKKRYSALVVKEKMKARWEYAGSWKHRGILSPIFIFLSNKTFQNSKHISMLGL
jgi:hypothetical protein